MSDDRRLSDDIDAEISDHLERRTRVLRDTGLSEAAARARAHAEFGDLSAAKSDLRRIDARMARRQRPRIWSGLGGDVRTASRRLAGQPAATALTILTLGLAIGVAAAVFTVIDQLILRPPPFLHGERLVNVWSQTRPGQRGGSGLTPEKLATWRQQTAVFERLEAYIGASFDLTDLAEPSSVQARVVSTGLFEMLGIGMHIGRPFAEGDGAPGREKVVILSHGFWATRFGGSPEVLGTALRLNGEPHTVIGVLRPGTQLLTDDEPLWLPVDLEAARTQTPAYRYYGIGRLNASIDAETARSTAAALAAALERATPLPGTWHIGIEEKRAASVGSSTRRTLFVLLGAVTLLLLIACVNVTSVTLGQMLRRTREMRLRAAIGAGRWRLLRESVVETLLLAAAAGLAGAIIAEGALVVLLTAAPDGLAFMTTRAVEIDGRVLGLMTGATLTAGLLSGLLPGLRASRVDLSNALRDGARDTGRGMSFGGGIGALVVVEVAIAMVLLTGAALMGRTLAAYYRVEPGFDVDRLTTVYVGLPANRYPNAQSRSDFFDALDAALRQQPGIESAAHAWGIPPMAGSLAGALQGEGRASPTSELEYFANTVSHTYFETTGTRLRAGRAFGRNEPSDHVIVSEALAREIWGEQPVVGRRLRESPDDPWLTVVGVAGNVQSRWNAGERSDLQIYYPVPADVRQTALPGRTAHFTMLIVRASDPDVVHAAIRERLRQGDVQLVGTFTSAADLYARPFAEQRFLLTVMGAFAAMALLLAGLGIFGVLSQAVARRRREIGIRVALGASSRRVVRMLVGRGLVLAAMGAAIGTAASLAGVRALESLLFGVSPFDIVSFASVIVLLMAVALIACWWPTRRALAVEPAEVLRSE